MMGETPNTAVQNDLATRPARPLRIVKIGSEGIAIKPDTGDLRTDMQTVAMCGLDAKLALMFAAAPDMGAFLLRLRDNDVPDQEELASLLAKAGLL